jgi:ABC-type uncharacterized transport system ATPase subunit
MLNRRKAQTISDDAIQLLNIRVPHASSVAMVMFSWAASSRNRPCSLRFSVRKPMPWSMVAGLVGAGRSELAQLIFGVRKATGGVIEIDGEPVVAGGFAHAKDQLRQFGASGADQPGEADDFAGMHHQARAKPSTMASAF